MIYIHAQLARHTGGSQWGLLVPSKYLSTAWAHTNLPNMHTWTHEVWVVKASAPLLRLTVTAASLCWQVSPPSFLFGPPYYLCLPSQLSRFSGASDNTQTPNIHAATRGWEMYQELHRKYTNCGALKSLWCPTSTSQAHETQPFEVLEFPFKYCNYIFVAKENCVKCSPL